MPASLAKRVHRQIEAPESWDVPLRSTLLPDSEASERRNLPSETGLNGLIQAYTQPDTPPRERNAQLSAGADEIVEIDSVVANRQSPQRAEVATVPIPQAPTHEIQVLQQWDGTVTHVREGEFTALLRDIRRSSDTTRVEAVFGLEDVSPGDRHLVSPGAVFTWTIGREKAFDGQVKNIDFIRFLRLPAWSSREVEAVQRRAAELKSRFGNENEADQQPARTRTA